MGENAPKGQISITTGATRGITKANYENDTIYNQHYFFPWQSKPRTASCFTCRKQPKTIPPYCRNIAEYQAALQKVPQAGSLPDPELNMGVFLSPMELVSGNQVAELRLMQMFPWFGTLRAAKDEMSLMANAKYELFRDAKLQVFYEVQSTWFDLYKLRQNILISEKNH